MKYRFIQEQSRHYPITVICRVLEIRRKSYYQWLGKPRLATPEKSRLAEARKGLLKGLFERHNGTLGARRLRAMIKDLGHK